MARDFSRTDRVADLIQRELALLIHQHINDPRVGIITLSRVQISKDLAHAKIFVNVMMEEAATESIKTLNKASGFLRGLLAKRLKMRVVPHLFFIYDDTTIKATRLARLIDQACSPKKDNDDNAHHCAK